MEPGKRNSSTPALTESAASRRAEIRTEISTQLRPVNAWMSSAAFDELMDEMSLLQLAFEIRTGITPGEIDTRVGPSDRRATSAATRLAQTTPGEPLAIPVATPRGPSAGEG